MEAKEKLKIIKNVRLGLMIANMILDSYEQKIAKEAGIKMEDKSPLSMVTNLMENLDLENMFKSSDEKKGVK